MNTDSPPANARYEVKFVASPVHAARLRYWLAGHRAGFSPFYVPRQVNNIYFDTPQLECLQQNIAGVSRRGKLRYRWYGNLAAKTCGALEYKIKRNCYGWKKIFPLERPLELECGRWRIAREELRRHVSPQGRQLMDCFPQPVIINSYQRQYFLSRDGNVRVTLDTELEVFDQQGSAHLNLRRRKLLPELVVVEFKAERCDRALVDRCIQGIPVRAGKHSKYVSGVLASAC